MWTFDNIANSFSKAEADLKAKIVEQVNTVGRESLHPSLKFPLFESDEADNLSHIYSSYQENNICKLTHALK